MISYEPLRDTLRRKNMKKKDLMKVAGLSSGTIAKLGKGESVSMTVIDRICEALDVGMSDVVLCEHDDDVYLTMEIEVYDHMGQPEFFEHIISRGSRQECRQVMSHAKAMIKEAGYMRRNRGVYIIRESEFSSRAEPAIVYQVVTPESIKVL